MMLTECLSFLYCSPTVLQHISRSHFVWDTPPTLPLEKTITLLATRFSLEVAVVWSTSTSSNSIKLYTVKLHFGSWKSTYSKNHIIFTYGYAPPPGCTFGCCDGITISHILLMCSFFGIICRQYFPLFHFVPWIIGVCSVFERKTLFTFLSWSKLKYQIWIFICSFYLDVLFLGY